MKVQRERFAPPQIIIANDGPLLTDTNYWSTEPATKGLFYLSINAGCMRLLMPQAALAYLPQMTVGVREVILTRGRYEDGNEAVEMMFEDTTDEPFCLFLDPRQLDRRWAGRDEGKPWRFAIYTGPETRRIADFARCFVRTAPTLPYLKPWRG